METFTGNEHNSCSGAAKAHIVIGLVSEMNLSVGN